MSRAARYLLVDVGNTRTKFAFAGPERVGRMAAAPTHGLTAEAVRKIIGNRRIDRVVVSSVVPDALDPLREAAGGGDKLLVLDHRLKLGIGIDFPKPETIGADRLANAAAVAELYGCPAVVLDFGTAVTFDVVSPQRTYVGGVIAPGLEAMTLHLHEQTALLPKIRLKEPEEVIGRSTRAAMLAGAVHGYRGLVKEILSEIRGEVAPRGRKLHIVATGGYADLICARIPVIEHVRPRLNLEGLRIIANLNQ